MSDFMKWLYINYIKPQIDAEPYGDYEMAFSLMEGALERCYWESYEKTIEFAALQAFRLGVRTGKGLADSFTG